MDRIELHDVEYGDCTVLVGRDQSILMVDCGSVSQYTRQDDTEMDARFRAVFARYAAAAERQFLLTHYHRDHMNGFLKKLRQDPGYFDRVYIPVLPGGVNGNPMLELAVFSRFFTAPQGDFAQMNTTCLTIFELLHRTVGAERIFTLRAGDVFSFDHVQYGVLSPDTADFPYAPLLLETVSALNGALAPFPAAGEFLRLKGEFIRAYTDCQRAFSPQNRETNSALHARLDSLSALWADLEQTRSTLEFLPIAETVRALLCDSAVRALYTETQNDLSLVFHTLRRTASNADILLPGDASAAVLNRLVPKLYDSYFVVKAPHHGTESHYADVLGQLTVSHLLISNGDYHAGGGISGRYSAMESIKHCTNRSACGWFRENQSCCNRLLRCYEQPAAGSLTLKCTAAAGNRRTPCGIYVFGHNGVRACHCDRV